MDWNPHSLVSCMDSPVVAGCQVILALSTTVLHTLIACHFWYVSERSRGAHQSAARMLVAIFVCCGLTGYLTMVVRMSMPRTGIVLHIVGLMLLQVISIRFLLATHRMHKNHTEASTVWGNQPKTDHWPLNQLSDDELAKLSRRLRSEFGRQDE